MDAKPAKKNPAARPSLRSISLTPFCISQMWYVYELAMEKILKPFNITHIQCFTMWLIYFMDPPITVTALAQIAGREPHSMVSLIDKLQERKLVRRKRSKTDRRVVEITLTDKGTEFLNEILPSWQTVQVAVFQKEYTAEELDRFKDLLIKARDASIKWLGEETSDANANLQQVDNAINNEYKSFANDKKLTKTD